MPPKIFKHFSNDGRFISSKWEIDPEIQPIVKLKQRIMNKTTVCFFILIILIDSIIFHAKRINMLKAISIEIQ